MSRNFEQSTIKRLALLKIYHLYARSQIWRTGRPILINSIPKAGTHLATSIFQTIPGLTHSRTHVDMWTVDKGKRIHAPVSEFEPDRDTLRRVLSVVRGKQIATAHLPYREEIRGVLNELGFITFFMTREQEAIIESYLYYVTNLRRHYLHTRLCTEYHTNEERREAIKNGIPWNDNGPGLDPAQVIFDQFSEWTKLEHVTTIRFEDLVGGRRGEGENVRNSTISEILSKLGITADEQTVREISHAARRKKSPTLRSGQA